MAQQTFEDFLMFRFALDDATVTMNFLTRNWEFFPISCRILELIWSLYA